MDNNEKLVANHDKKKVKNATQFEFSSLLAINYLVLARTSSQHVIPDGFAYPWQSNVDEIKITTNKYVKLLNANHWYWWAVLPTVNAIRIISFPSTVSHNLCVCGVYRMYADVQVDKNMPYEAMQML